jgi:hypothetical protein
VSKHDIGSGGHLAIVAAAICGLACAAVGGPAGLVAVAWSAATLVAAWRRAKPWVGVTTLGLTALYGLAAVSGFVGSDAEEVGRHVSLRLAVVALGCAVVGVTSAVVWLTASSRHR